MIHEIFLLAVCHFIGDFIFQSDYVATNKSKDDVILMWHCFLYILPFMFISLSLPFLLFIGVTHFIVDYFTSRGTSYFWKTDNRHWFFVLIGFDQLIHFMFNLMAYDMFR